MGLMFDAVNPANIPPGAHGGPVLRITVLADPAGEAFDVEGGNAPAAQVAAAMVVRHNLGEWSIGYVNATTFHDLTAAMGVKGLHWTDPEMWPAVGIYLWAADPDDLIGSGAWAPPVAPLAHQTGYRGTYDESVTVANFPATAAGYIDGPVSKWPDAAWADYRPFDGTAPLPVPPAPPVIPPAPPAPVEGTCTVLLPILAENSQGPAVAAAQKLLGGLAADGVFGPLTLGGVRAFQEVHHLTVDGVVGAHTWGALLGAPQ